MTPRVMFKISNILKPYRWLIFACFVVSLLLAYWFLPQPSENSAIGYSELTHILILLGVFWSATLVFILVLCRGLPVKPQREASFVIKTYYYVKLIFTWYFSVFMGLYLLGLIFGTVSFFLKNVSGS